MASKLEKELEANNNEVQEKTIALAKQLSSFNNKTATIKNSFYPLGLYAKLFGLFPCYDLNFTPENSTNICPFNKITVRSILDYLYSSIFCITLTIGSIMCAIDRPIVLENMKDGNEQTDAIAILTIFYSSMAVGILSYFIFPTKFRFLLHYIEHFASIDKILQFQNNWERKFSIRLCIQLTFIVISTTLIYIFMFILELPERTKGFTDYLMVIVSVVAGMAMIIPSALFIFFLNGIRLRLISFNKKMSELVLPITPSCFICEDYKDYGYELQGQVCPRKSKTLEEDLEKMRILHQEIVELASETSDIFGSHLLRYFLLSIIGIILFTYFIIFLREEDLLYWYIYPFLDTFLVIKLFFVTGYCHSITYQGYASKKLLNKASQRYLTSECALQVQLFIKQLDTPVQITAYGYFTINHGLITSILGAVTTYFIILVQFKINDNSAELRKLQASNYTCQEIIALLL